ncbi:MAG: LicD family protein [Chitinispirillales bacterium]|jgi:lipopolysaccharide cholinephosphotransferase|nr:LicD family protein [Chitinispirillales bacterium]
MKKLNELQSVELDILKEFSHAAKAHGLSWFAMFGTLLGAVRYGGFIPWDGDIDIALPRIDYDRLRHNPDWFTEPYFLQTPYNDPAAAPRFTRLRRSDTTNLYGFNTYLTRGGNMGAYIDIIPLDDVPNGAAAHNMQETVMKINDQMLASAALDECYGIPFPIEKENFCFGAGGVAGLYPMLAERYEKFCSKYTDNLYYAMPVLAGERGCRVYDKEWFRETAEMNFEDIKIPAPTGWKEVLIASFPEGTYELDLKYRKAKHTQKCVVDMSRSYKEYVRRYTDMLCEIENKQVFIFGAGDSLRIWLERYGKGLKVICAFDNSKSKWRNKSYGVTIRNPAELPELLNDNSRLIIASIHHEEISKQLENMGISDYYIFIDGLRY